MGKDGAEDGVPYYAVIAAPGMTLLAVIRLVILLRNSFIIVLLLNDKNKNYYRDNHSADCQ